MDHRANRPYPGAGALILAVAVAAILIPACGDDPGSPEPDETERIVDYAGTWTQNGTSGTLDATKSLAISTDLAYTQTVDRYASTAKVDLASTRTVTATVTRIATDEANADYDTIFIDVHEVRMTPKSAAEATEWNDMEYGGISTWVPDQERTFDSANPGPWEFGTVWLDHVAVSVRREGDLLNVNERGGFDGEDPPEDVYFLDD